MLMKACLLILISLMPAIPLFAETAAYGTVKGSVWSDDGIALAYANVMFYQGSSRITGGQSNGGGEFAVKVPAGTYRCRVMLIGYHDLDSLHVTVEAGQTTTLPISILNKAQDIYDLPQNTRGAMSIEVTDTKGKSLVNSFCTIHSDSIRVAACRPGIKGSVTLNLLPSLYTVRVSAEGYKPVWYHDVPVELGKTCPLTAVLKPLGRNKHPEPILRKYTQPRIKIRTLEPDSK